MSIKYIFKSGKNIKLFYYIQNYIRLIIPDSLYRNRLNDKLTSINQRLDFDYIMERVDYYNALTEEEQKKSTEYLPLFTETRNQKLHNPKVYYFDSIQYARYFPEDYKWNLIPGDVVDIPQIPSIVKSRPIGCDNKYAVIAKLDKIRHFVYVNDKICFEDKQNRCVFRGKVGCPGKPSFKANRYRFLEMYKGNPMCDVGEIVSSNYNEKWACSKLTLNEHLNYKFIMCLEGNDVASNLKWVMSSNSLAVMPLPKYETWFMEGKLIPNVHYVEIESDFSDLEEKMNYYISHPEEAKIIIKNANKYVSQFRDIEREDLISLLVFKKYFERTNKRKY